MKKILLTTLIMAITTPAFCQCNDSTIVTGQLHLQDIGKRQPSTHNRDSINLDNITLGETQTIRGKISPHPAYQKADISASSHTDITIYNRDRKKILKLKRRNNIEDVTIDCDTTLNDTSFELKLRKGRYFITFVGLGYYEKYVTIRSKPIDLGEIELGPLIISPDGTNYKR